MIWLRRLRERRGANRDLSMLWGQVHDLADYLEAVKRELVVLKPKRAEATADPESTYIRSRKFIRAHVVKAPG